MSGNLCLAMAWYHCNRSIKNIYMLLWFIMVPVSITVFNWYWLANQSISGHNWTTKVINYGIIGAYLLLPWLVRSIAPAFAPTQGAEFLSGRTDYLGLDTIITLLVNIFILSVLAVAGIWIAASIIGILLNFSDLITTVFLILLPTLLLFVTLTLVLLLAFPLPTAVLTFWVILGVFSVIPGLAPWDGIDILSHGQTYLNTPIILVNRLFCLLGACLLAYIYILWLKNQSCGQANTRLRQKQGCLAEEKAVILGSRGLILGNNRYWELLKKEIKIISYSRLILGGIGAAICGWLSNYHELIGLAGIGIVILFTTTLLSPKNSCDRLILGYYRRRFLFILIRNLLPLCTAVVLIVIFGLLGSIDAASKVLCGFIVVWGWAALGSHFWSLLTVRILAALFWTAVIFFPGALTMTLSSRWWLISGLFMMITAAFLYRRDLYPE